MSLYVLELNGDKYYVGVTEDLPRRIAEHFCGEGASEWTKLYPPLKVVFISDVKNPLEEDLTTESYMIVHGIENVRGGSYSNVTLTPAQREVLNLKICTANSTCFRCGKPGHFAKGCSA